MIARNMPILVPGIEEQKGNLKAVVQNGLDEEGFGSVINVSHSIIYVSFGKDFVASAKEAVRLRNQINRIRREVQCG